MFTVLAIGAVASRRGRGHGDPRATLLCLLAATVTLAYAWIVHVPAAYFRMAYFLPLALVPLGGRPRPTATGPRSRVVGGGAALVIAAFAWPQAEKVRDFYAFSNSGSLRGLDAVGRPSARARWWSRTAAGASRRLAAHALAALEPEDIQPSAELRRARQARAVLDGTPSGMASPAGSGCASWWSTRPAPTRASGRRVRPRSVARSTCRSGWWCCGCPGLG